MFKQKRPETLDLTELQRKGILQRSRKIAQANAESPRSSEVIDLTKKSIAPQENQTNPQSPFDFLQNTVNTSTVISGS